MFGNYSTMAHRHIQGEVGFFDPQGDEEAFLKSRPPLSQDIIQGYKPPNPWPSSPSFEGDFVLVCEFSELEGPKPVMTIPQDSGGDFEENDFALKIMSIDYNATNIVRSGGTFSLVQDIGVILEEPKESAFAYVHHFTLYDVVARGYVRPFCMAYITSDRRKIIRNMEWLMKQFGKVSETFRFGNRSQFHRDLKRRLADIQYTMEDLKSRSFGGINGTTSQVAPASDGTDEARHKVNQKLSALEKGLQDVQEILDILAPELVNSKLEAQFEKLEKLARSKTHHQPRRRQHSSSIHEDGYHSDSEDIPAKETPRRRLRRTSTCDGISDLPSSLENSDTYSPQIIRVDGYRKFDIRLRTLHELCGWGYKAGLSRVRKMHKHLSRSSLILYMEKKESRLIDPSSSLLTIGRAVTINFMHEASLHSVSNDEGWQDETDSQSNSALKRLISNASTSSASPSMEENAQIRPISLTYEATFVPGTAYASMESLYYDVNECLDVSNDDDSDEICEIPKRLNSNCTFVSSDNGSWLEVDFSSKDYRISSSPDAFHQLPFKSGHCCKLVGLPSDEVDGGSPVKEVMALDNTADSSLISSSPSQAQNLQGLETSLAISMADSYVIRRNQKVSVGSYISRINSFNTYLPGSGVRNFSQSCYAIHLIYALLSGRTVIVVASPRNEKNVTAMIRTLWLFVPGHSSMHHLVVPWHTQPLCISDLSCMKLIGLSRHKAATPVIPPDVRDNSIVFDYDTRELSPPYYKGYHLTQLIKNSKHFRSDRAYIAFLHCYLLELAQKAFVYYHTYCLNPPDFQPVTGHDAVDMVDTANGQMKQASLGYLNKLGIADCDVHIIEYWVEIMKQQQAYEKAGSSVVQTPSAHSAHRFTNEMKGLGHMTKPEKGSSFVMYLKRFISFRTQNGGSKISLKPEGA